jgi:hypothetical protein
MYFIRSRKQAGGPGGTSAAEGVAVDSAGNVYGAEAVSAEEYIKKAMLRTGRTGRTAGKCHRPLNLRSLRWDLGRH